MRSGLPCLVGVARVVKVLITARRVAACARSVGSTLGAVLVGRFSLALRPDSHIRLPLGHCLTLKLRRLLSFRRLLVVCLLERVLRLHVLEVLCQKQGVADQAGACIMRKGGARPFEAQLLLGASGALPNHRGNDLSGSLLDGSMLFRGGHLSHARWSLSGDLNEALNLLLLLFLDGDCWLTGSAPV